MTARKTTRPTCSIDGCDGAVNARGWCSSHYNRWHRHGDPLAGDATRIVVTGAVADRFWSRVRKTETCWIWTGELNDRGYGRFRFDRRRVPAYRWSYEHQFGSIPEGLELDHLCRNRACVRPSHLEPVTHRENILRGYRARVA